MRRLFALLALVAACGGGRPRAPMTDGERMYLAKCTACHSAYEPASRTPQGWADAIDEMEAKKKVHLQPDERALILTYLAGDAGAGGPRADPARAKANPGSNSVSSGR